MQQEPPNTEQRLADLETVAADLQRQVADLQRRVSTQTDLDMALLVRIDGVGETARKMEKDQRIGFEALQTGQKEQGSRLDLIERNIAVLAEAATDHKQDIERVATDQSTMAKDLHQLVQTLLGGGQGGPKTND